VRPLQSAVRIVSRRIPLSASTHRAPSGGGGGMEAGGEEFAIGVVISAKTTLGEEFEGQIVAFDRPSNLLVIHILPKSLMLLTRISMSFTYRSRCSFARVVVLFP